MLVSRGGEEWRRAQRLIRLMDLYSRAFSDYSSLRITLSD